MLGSNSLFFIILSFKFAKPFLWAIIILETILSETLKNNRFCCLVLSTVTDEFELQLTKTGDKARNCMTMFQNWLTKHDIETSIRTFQSVRVEIETPFLFKLNEEVTKMGGETYIYHKVSVVINWVIHGVRSSPLCIFFSFFFFQALTVYLRCVLLHNQFPFFLLQ